MPNSIRFGRPGSATSISRTTNLPTITAFTAMGWFRIVTNGGGFAAMFVHGGTTGGSYYFIGAVNNGTTFGVAVNGATTNGAVSFTVGRWHHVALTVNGTSGSNVLGYLDGVLGVTATAASVTALKLWMGNNPDSDFFDGNAAAIKIYNRVLTVDEIIKEIPYAVPVDPAGLNDAMPIPSGWDLANSGLVLPRSVTTRWADVSGNANAWTEAGVNDTEDGPPIQFAPSVRRFRARYHVAAAGGSTFNDSRTEALSAAETETAQADFVAARSETLTAAESSTGALVAAVARTETLTAAESSTGALAAVGADSESLSATDAQSATQTAVAATAETLAATDAQTGTMDAPVARVESLSATDSQDASVAAGGTSTCSDSLTATDSATATVVFAVSAAETLAASDSATATFSVQVAVGESLAAVDAPSANYVVSVARVESLSAADASTGIISGTVEMGEHPITLMARSTHTTLAARSHHTGLDLQ